MRQRKVWLDYARVFAILSISCNHAISRSFPAYATAYDAYVAFPITGSALRGVIFIFSRLGVPFFLMITGGLLLNKSISDREDVARFYRHNLGRLLVTCEIWTFLAFWFIALFSQRELLHGGVLRVLLRCVGSLLFINQVDLPSMWYIPLILCLYLLIPYVNILVNRNDGRLMLIPCAVVFLGGMLIPTVNAVCKTAGIPLSLDFALSGEYLFSMYMLYVLAGYWVSKDCFKKVPGSVLLLAALLTFAIACAYQAWVYTIPGARKTYYGFLPMALCAVFLFACFHRRADKLRESRLITYVSKISFGIYFVHYYIMALLVRVLPRSGMHPLVLFFVLELVSVGGSIVVIYVLSKISVLKKYLFMIKD